MTPRPAGSTARAASTPRTAATPRAGSSTRATSTRATSRAAATRSGASPRGSVKGTPARSRATVGNTALAPRPTSPAPAGAARRRPALSVVPPADVPAPRTPFVLLVVVLVAAGLVGLLLLNTAINENAFRLHEVEQRQETLDLREQQLEGDLERLEAPGTLQAAARRLGLVPAGNPAYIHLPSGRVVGVPTPARAPAAPVTKPPASPAGKPSTAAAKPATPTTKPAQNPTDQNPAAQNLPAQNGAPAPGAGR